MHRNVLIDCGTHFGQGLAEFVNMFGVDSSWIVHSFEANPVTYRMLESGQGLLPVYKDVHRLAFVQYHNQAVSTYDGTVAVQVETPPGEGETGMGTSIISLDKWDPHSGGIRQNFLTSYTVPCIDFAKFLQTNFTPNDRIIIKMDIEGSEYDVLEHMDNLGVLSYVDFLAVEWHSRFFTNKDEMLVRETQLLNRITTMGITYKEWH